jgi:cytochrome c
MRDCPDGLAAAGSRSSFGDAGLDAARPTQTILENASVPADVRATLTAKCADCHSTATRLPVYDRIAVRFAPASWLIERDIVDGRKHMNLSAWNNYSADQQQVLLSKSRRGNEGAEDAAAAISDDSLERARE